MTARFCPLADLGPVIDSEAGIELKRPFTRPAYAYRTPACERLAQVGLESQSDFLRRCALLTLGGTRGVGALFWLGGIYIDVRSGNIDLRNVHIEDQNLSAVSQGRIALHPPAASGRKQPSRRFSVE